MPESFGGGVCVMPYKLSKYPEIVLSDEEYKSLQDSWQRCGQSPLMSGMGMCDFPEYVKVVKEQQRMQILYNSTSLLPAGIEYVE